HLLAVWVVHGKWTTGSSLPVSSGRQQTTCRLPVVLIPCLSHARQCISVGEHGRMQESGSTLSMRFAVPCSQATGDNSLPLALGQGIYKPLRSISLSG